MILKELEPFEAGGLRAVSPAAAETEPDDIMMGAMSWQDARARLSGIRGRPTLSQLRG